jgi:hypothetical protein
MELYKAFVDFLYLVPLQLFLFRRNNPSLQIIVYGACKGRKFRQSKDIQIAPGWMWARRQALILNNKALVCGDWVIRLGTIKDAVLTKINGSSGCVLSVTTETGEHYQFGLQYIPAWETQTTLPLRFEYQTRIPMSLISMLIRVIIVAYLVYYVLQLLNIL